MTADEIVAKLKEVAVSLTEVAEELRKDADKKRRARLYSWEQLYMLANGKGMGEPELEAKDNARAQIEQRAAEEGYDLKAYESIEDGIDRFLEVYPQYDGFDIDGNMWDNWKGGRDGL